MALITLDVRLLDVDGLDIVDPSVTFRLESTDVPVVKQARLAARGAPIHARVEAPAGSALKVRISPSRYRDGGRVGLLTAARLSLEPLTLPRRPDRWLPAFSSWSSLTADFDSTKALLRRSERFQLGRGSDAEQLIEDRYDAVDASNESRALAKMCLLNLCSRLRGEIVPGGDTAWIDDITELILGQRDRCFALVKKTFFDRVRELSRKAAGGYSRSNAENHRSKVAEVPGVEHVGEMFSIKSGEKKANIQLTVAKVRYRGSVVNLLDADVDEHGTFLGHTFEVARNFLTNHETHPIDIHESLRQAFATAPLGYGLDPLQPLAEVAARVIDVRTAVTSVMVPRRVIVRTGTFTPAHIAVLGDSVPWGQGLLPAQKMHELVADEYETGGPRPALTLVAHSGALIGVGMRSTGTLCHGEVPKGRPTILQQVASFDASLAKSVDLVIINGGINDVDIRAIVSPFTSTTTLADKTSRACGDDLLVLLQAALKKFPNARLAVLAYYPILSAKSRFGDGQQFLMVLGAPPPVALVPAPGLAAFSLWDRIVSNCRVFHEASSLAIRKAVTAANKGSSPARCVVADPGFTDEHAALAPDARLFGINWDFSPQDPVAHERKLACDRCEQDLLRREQCYRASAGHPNQPGAEDYAAAIVAALD